MCPIVLVLVLVAVVVLGLFLNLPLHPCVLREVVRGISPGTLSAAEEGGY